MSITSANPVNLQTFVDSASGARATLFSQCDAVIRSATAVVGACSYGHPSTFALNAVGPLLDNMYANEQFVSVVHDAVVSADRHSGRDSVDDSIIGMALDTRGLSQRPGPIAVQKMELYGLTPTSGFVDDPICAANGNFVHGDEDLSFPGFAGLLGVTRIYNSLAHRRPGIFGPGWTSVLDQTVDPRDQDLVQVTLADGACVGFARTADGAYEPDQRRRLTLSPGESGGWTLADRSGGAWEFDSSGALTRMRLQAAVAVVERSDDSIVVSEERSGRWVRYALQDGRVVSALASDGRHCSYEYDGEHLTGVRRVTGDLTYVIDGDLIISVVDADGRVLCRNEYDEDGRVLAQTSPHGRRTHYEYGDLGQTRVTDEDGGPINVMVHDRQGNLLAAIDGDGSTLRLEYDGRGQVRKLVDRTGAATLYEHDELGNLVSRSDPDGRTHSWVWDLECRLVEETDRAGGRFLYSYDGPGRSPSVIEDPGGGRTVTIYNELGLPVLVTDADGVETRFEWTADGQLGACVDGLGGRTTFEFDSAGLVVGVRNPSGVSAEMTTDAAGRVVAAHTADGIEEIQYSAAGRAVAGTLNGGGAWRASFDPAGEVREVADSTGASIKFERDKCGNLVGITAADGAVYRFDYDAVGRVTRSIDPAGHETSAAYDLEGRLVEVTDGSGRRWRREVDFFGRTTSIELPGGASTVRAYHPNGEVASVTDSDGNQWMFDVDAMGRNVAVVDPLDNRTTYTFSPAGRLLSALTPMGRSRSWSYDEAGRVAVASDASGKAIRYERRADGKAVAMNTPWGEFRFGYHGSGRPESVDGPGHHSRTTWRDGRMVEIALASSPAGFDWDPRGLLDRAIDAAGTATSFSYDARGRLVAQATAGCEMRRGYDEAGWLTTVIDPTGEITEIANDEVGLPATVRRPDGHGLVISRGDNAQPDTVRDLSGELVAGFRYDAAGRIIGATSGDVETHIQRDGLGRIVAVDDGTRTTRYEWDADGGLVGRNDATGPLQIRRSTDGSVAAYVLGAGVEIDPPSTSEELAVERDDGGRLLVDEYGRIYRYDDAGRLTETVGTDGAHTEYGYNQLGLLGSESGQTGTRTYVYGASGQLTRQEFDGGEFINYEYDRLGRRTGEVGSDGTVVSYTWNELDRLVQVKRSGVDVAETSHTIIYDGLGNPVEVDGIHVTWDLGLSGKVISVGEKRVLRHGAMVRSDEVSDVWSRHVPEDPWGSDDENGVRLGYRGELAVDGLVFLGARVYDATTRSFLSRDPQAPTPGELAFAGPYAYAGNDPVNFVDPTGLHPISEKDYDAIRRQQEKGCFEKAWDSIKKDPWGTLGMVALVAGACIIGGPIGVGILIGAGISAGVGLATGTFNPRSVIIGGVVGGFTGGFAGGGASLGTTVLVGAGGAGGGNLATQIFVEGKGLNQINWGQVGLQTLEGGATAGALHTLFNGVPSSAASDDDNYVNLASKERTTHILDGDQTGGGHQWPGLPGKTPFPPTWSSAKIMHEISDIATDPADWSTAVNQGRNTVISGVRDGIDIKVIVDSKTGEIISGFPTNLPRNLP